MNPPKTERSPLRQASPVTSCHELSLTKDGAKRRGGLRDGRAWRSAYKEFAELKTAANSARGISLTRKRVYEGLFSVDRTRTGPARTHFRP